MPNTEAVDPFREDASLLYPDNRGRTYARYREMHYETPIIKGVAAQLRKWPEDVFFAFLAACLIVGCLAFLIFVTVVICVPTALGKRVEEISILEIEASPSVYFLKLENRSWSSKEFCYMETAARRNPELNVYLINLMKTELTEENVNQSSTKRRRLETESNGSKDYNFLILKPEEVLRKRLEFENRNIKNIDVSIDRFFHGSKLSTVAKELDEEVLEIAAKAQLLWGVPGIALKPDMFCNVDSMKNYLCNQSKGNCTPDKLATLGPENGIQLTGVPCQAFMGFLVQEISRNNHNGRYTLKEAIEKYCPRLHYCPEIRILESKKCATNNLDCPTVYSAILMHNNVTAANLIS